MTFDLTLQMNAGHDLLDLGLRDLLVIGAGADAVLVAATGPQGGLTMWSVDDTPGPHLLTSAYFTSHLDSVTSGSVSVLDDRWLVVGADANGLVAFDYADGTLSQLASTVPFAMSGVHRFEALTTGPHGYLIASDLQTGRLLSLADDGSHVIANTPLHSPVVETTDQWVVVTDQVDNSVKTFDVSVDGDLSHIASLGAESGLAVDAPNALDIVSLQGRQFVIVGAANTHSLSVLELSGDGGLTMRDHVVDTRHTRFGAVQALIAVEIDGQVVVVAAGGDDGLSVFSLLPDGRLLHRQTLIHGPNDGLSSIVDLEAVVLEQSLRVFAISEDTQGIAVLDMPLADLGLVGTGPTLAGDGGDDLLIAEGRGARITGNGGSDVLVAGPDAVLTGGAGSDVFVFRHGDDAVITDFSPGDDSLDLSAFPLLRHPDQLDFLPTQDGAMVTYKGTRITLETTNNASLNAEDVFGGAFLWPDRFFYLPNDTDAKDPKDPPVDPQEPAPDTAILLREGVANAGFENHSIWLTLPQQDPMMISADTTGQFSLNLDPGTQAYVDIHRPTGDLAGQITVSDALEVLRVAVGLDPNGGPASPLHYLAADVTGDQRVTVQDALEVLRFAVGLPGSTPPEWRYYDATLDFGAITRDANPFSTGVPVEANGDPVEIEMIGVLTADLDSLL